MRPVPNQITAPNRLPGSGFVVDLTSDISFIAHHRLQAVGEFFRSQQ